MHDLVNDCLFGVDLSKWKVKKEYFRHICHDAVETHRKLFFKLWHCQNWFAKFHY